jgi:hypothetical protein
METVRAPHEDLTPAIYGTLVATGVIAASQDDSALESAGFVVLTGLAFTIAHVFARWSGDEREGLWALAIVALKLWLK